ncbi:MAG: tripartite tricarboxylate transporter substrate binding protein [Frateuria sp.]|nr:tripartite tricarboxylate transporter substrate binding protein [Frateuria sp.]
MRALLLGLATTLLAITSAWAAPAEYPTHALRIIVPLSAGGPTDTLARIVAQPLSARLGQPVIIENRPGAGGNIGAEIAAKAPADGYTLFLGTSGPLSINQSLYSRLAFDPARDFAPVIALASAPFVVAATGKAPFNSLADLVTYARQSPGKLNAGSVPGAAAHLATELFQSVAQIRLVNVPYKGAAPATNDLLAGQIDLSFASTPGVLPHVRAGKLQALAVTSSARLPQLPNVPTVAESFPGYEASVWYGVVVPAATPNPIIQRLNRELAAVLQDPKVRQQMAANDFTPTGSTPEDFGRFIASESRKWGEVIKAKGIHAD